MYCTETCSDIVCKGGGDCAVDANTGRPTCRCNHNCTEAQVLYTSLFMVFTTPIFIASSCNFVGYKYSQTMHNNIKIAAQAVLGSP